jgi:hypothetical protein
MLPEPHPDVAHDYTRLKQIQRGGQQAIEDKAIAEYMRDYEAQGREAAEKIFFKHFTNSKKYNQC